jgi:hypothetical protein
MSQARPQAWWRQAQSDLDLAALASRHGFQAQACFFATQAAEKALKGAIIELGREPPHTHALELFDPADAAQAIGTAKAVLAWVEGLDLPEGDGGERGEQ